MAAVFATLLVARLRTAFLAALPDNVAASCEDFAVAADARLADALVTFLAGALPGSYTPVMLPLTVPVLIQLSFLSYLQCMCITTTGHPTNM
ncbi:hypothetical protein P2H51_09570, partial [Xanthomonas perforans]